MPKTRALLGGDQLVHPHACLLPKPRRDADRKYSHNVKVDHVHVDLSVVNTTRSLGGCGDNNGCMCVDDGKVNNFTFAADLASVGYQVGMFGKYLNSWSGAIQLGSSRWFANGGGAYFNTTFNDNRSPTGQFTANSTFYAGYQTSILGNVSINWITEVVTDNGMCRPATSHRPGRGGGD